ncbi:MAG: 5-carboxymethyl-2-hydroxymuconate Delta-isomerase [Candidatus Promineifilaceae bacterium]|nr:5-carboxymethyl-2-hydroxymuconate Delta-isomerase [Candidatus Promineifilaceae bacterium]
MPHLTLEYTDNLDFDSQSLLARLNDAMLATGAVNRKGLKSRALRLSEYRIADGFEGYRFVHLSILVKEGRSLDIRQEMTRRTMEILEETFKDQFEDGYISLSVDLKEMVTGIARTKHNIPEVE